MGSWAIRLLLALGGVVIFALHRTGKRCKSGGRGVLPCCLGKDPGARPLSLSPSSHFWTPRGPSHFRGCDFGSGVGVGIGSGIPSVPISRSNRLASTSRSAMSHSPTNNGSGLSTDPAFWTNDVDGFELCDPPTDDRHAPAHQSLYLPLPSRNFRCLFSSGNAYSRNAI